MAENNFSLQKTLTMLLDEKKYHSLRDILSTMNPADIAAIRIFRGAASYSVPSAAQGTGRRNVR